MDSTYLFFSFVPLAAFAVYNYKLISNYVIKSLIYSPGEGEIIKKGKNKYYVKTPDYDFLLNYIKTPSFDMSVHFFKKDIEFEDKLISIEKFKEMFEKKESVRLQNHYMGIIDDIYHTSNFKKGKVFGYISSIMEDKIYLFVIEEGVIDFRNIFKEYEKEFN